MCGIHASVSTWGFQRPSQELQLLLCKRGPDHLGNSQAEVSTNSDEESYFISFTSTVLALRGGTVTSQPFIEAKTGSLLCWNGEAWSIGPETVTGNDGQLVFDALISAISSSSGAVASRAAVLAVINSISGPFAFVFLDRTHKQVYFSRDRLGRRSLLYNATPASIEFSSTSDPNHGNWKEVEADGIYALSCHEGKSGGKLVSDDLVISSMIPPTQRYGWEVSSDSISLSLGLFNRNLPTIDYALDSQAESVRTLRNQLCESLKLRILNIPVPPALIEEQDCRVAILFSGGLDCTVLARMAHDILPPECQIDLINVAFENPRVVQAAKNTTQSKKRGKQDAGEQSTEIPPTKVLLDASPYETCPDRETGRKAFHELNQVGPTRIWRFIAVNVPYTETMAHRDIVISLIKPHNTEMDLSIAFALYFAARGSGIASSSVDASPKVYTTPARVLLSGLGADELFAGYTRHATAFNRKGYPGLLDELELDVNRLGKRNLGRDDRVIAHWGKEARFPYLDEYLVKWAVECPIWEKCGFGTAPTANQATPEIEPGKKVLRLLAYELGMHSVAQEKKRAIQFGARTAKMEIGRTKGTSLIA